MMKSVLCLLVLVALVGAACAVEDYTQRDNYVHRSVLSDPVRQEFMWMNWKAKHGREYASAAEESFRFGLFQASLKRVVAKNEELASRGRGPNYGVNRFSDMDPNEWANMYLNKRVTSEAKKSIMSDVKVGKPSKKVAAAMPSTLDWRQQNKVTMVNDQGQCGSCWAFSTCETVESAYAMKYGTPTSTLLDLSEQQILDCDWGDGNQGCDGGDPATAYAYVAKVGLESTETYPYYSGESGSNDTCSYQKSQVVATISGFAYATPPCDQGACANTNDVLLAQNMATYGPLGIIVDASNWQDYTFGTFSDCSSAYADMDHGVQVVGYEFLNATSGLTGTWIVRNSWNEDWGEQGYITLDGSQYGLNSCGLSNEAIYAIV